MIENRKLTRFSARLKVYSLDTGELLGYADNISIQGMHLLSKERIADRQQIRIWFGASGVDDDDRISVTAFKIWGGFNDSVPRLYSSGLYFEAPSEQILDKVQELLLTLKEQTILPI